MSKFAETRGNVAMNGSPAIAALAMCALCVAMPNIVAAKAAPVPTPSSACDNATSQVDMTNCAAQSSLKADAALNASYTRLMKRLSPPSQTRLRTAQRAWIAFRDAECLMESNGADGGSVAPMIRASCTETMSTARAKALDALGQCQEGDLSCPR